MENTFKKLLLLLELQNKQKFEGIFAELNKLSDEINSCPDKMQEMCTSLDERITELEGMDVTSEIKKEIEQLRSEIALVEAQKGDKGDSGKDGKDGIDGKDGKNGKDGADGIDGVDGKDGIDGKDGSPDDAQQIADKINTLDKAIDAKVIKNLPQFTREVIREVGGHAGAMETPVKSITTGKLVAKDASGAWLVNDSASSGGGIELGGPQIGFTNGMIQYIDQSGLQGGDTQFTRNSTTHDTTIQATYGSGTFGYQLDSGALFGSVPATALTGSNSGTGEAAFSAVIDPANLGLPGTLAIINVLQGTNASTAFFMVDGDMSWNISDNSNGYEIFSTMNSTDGVISEYDTKSSNNIVQISKHGTLSTNSFLSFFDKLNVIYADVVVGTDTVSRLSGGSTFKVQGNASVTTSSVTHNGTGLNDVTIGGTYTNYQNATMTVTCTGNDGGRIGFNASVNGILIGETVTQTTGTGAGTSAIVVVENDGRIWFKDYSPVGTGFDVSETIVFGTSGGTTTINNWFGGIGQDLFHSNVVYFDGTSNNDGNFLTAFGPITFDGSYSVTFATASFGGHTVNDSWVWGETVNYVDTLHLDPTSGIVRLRATNLMELETPKIIASTATLGDVFTLKDAATGEGEWETPTGGSGLTVGTTTIASGTSGRVLIDTAGVLQELRYDIPSTASSLVERDANQNAFANSFTSKATNVVSAAGTTTLTAASARWQNLTGTLAQTFQLPDATTLSIGAIFQFNNNSTGLLTVKDGGGTTLFTVPAGGQGFAVLLVNVVVAGVWDYHFSTPSNVQWGTTGLPIGNLLQSTNRLLGRTTASSGATEELTVGAGLTLSAGTLTASSNVVAGSIGITLDGQGGVITTGQKGGFITIPYSGTITGWTIFSTNGTTGAVTSGSIVVDTWKSTYAGFPPVVGGTIWGGSKPTLSSASKNTATGLSIAVTAGDVIGFNVDSVTTCTLVNVTILITKS